jgi:hypothetical protein
MSELALRCHPEWTLGYQPARFPNANPDMAPTHVLLWTLPASTPPFIHSFICSFIHSKTNGFILAHALYRIFFLCKPSRA